MRRSSVLALALVLAAALPAVAGAARRSSAPSQTAPQPEPAQTQSVVATCTFSNPGFSGKCVERVNVPPGSSPAQACGEILECLNSTGCTKTYCSATTIRTGWALDSAVVPKR
jgi:hypothetical protein